MRGLPKRRRVCLVSKPAISSETMMLSLTPLTGTKAGALLRARWRAATAMWCRSASRFPEPGGTPATSTTFLPYECSKPTAGGTNIGRAAELDGGNMPSNSPVYARPTPHDALGHSPVLPWSAPRPSGACVDRWRPVSSARPPLVLVALPIALGGPALSQGSRVNNLWLSSGRASARCSAPGGAQRSGGARGRGADPQGAPAGHDQSASPKVAGGPRVHSWRATS